mgnify:CR=1 FL=1
MQLGASNYLKKPAEIYELNQIVEKYKRLSQKQFSTNNYYYTVTEKKVEFSINNDLFGVPYIVDLIMFEIGDNISNSDKNGIQLGINELIVNAIEHGNLEISRLEKHQALEKNSYEKLYDERMSNSKLANRKVIIKLLLTKNKLSVEIEDEGNCFDWSNVPSTLNADNKEKFNGKGIFLSKYYFDSITYIGNGNKVRAESYITQ